MEEHLAKDRCWINFEGRSFGCRRNSNKTLLNYILTYSRLTMFFYFIFFYIALDSRKRGLGLTVCILDTLPRGQWMKENFSVLTDIWFLALSQPQRSHEWRNKNICLFVGWRSPAKTLEVHPVFREMTACWTVSRHLYTLSYVQVQRYRHSGGCNPTSSM